ncbi:Vacuolar membrane-associated protein iml1 [Phytophthora cinnamomi]|uniref:Vacuolar membrane-associated protein iml1 n=1 Tax=Phytophthora cinnamomi TaxID=4785 RepID=UPI00355A4AB8|nr:Vacuolar membrane-associated protein iml1 [Phytophthora cinnamomi]
MRRRYERRRAAKAKAAAAAAAEKAAPSAPDGSAVSTDAAAPTAATPTAKKRQTAVHAAAQIKLHVHGHEFQSGEEIVLNPDSFPQLKELAWKDYVVEVFHPEHAGERQGLGLASDGAAAAMAEGSPQNHLLLEIPESSAAPLKGKMQVSVLKDTAAMFQLAPFKDVTVRFLPKTQVEVDFVEVSLKDQFMSRRDLMYLKQSMVGTALYVGKTIRVQGTRWQVLDVRAGSEKVRSGVISENTKFTFRSRTSRIMWLVQVSPEMWDMANSGMLYLEIFLTVVRNVLKKWMKHKVTHSLTILFYSRCFYPEMDHEQESSTSGGRYAHRSFTPNKKASRSAADERESSFPYERSDCFSVGVDEDGRHYQDFYKLVAFDSIVTDVQPLLVKLKEEINAFPRECGWRSPADFYVSSYSPADMGHRIHEIVYNEETQTIDVKRYLQKVTTRSDVDIMEYRYSLWSPVVDRFVTVAQEFRKYPQIEYQWNHLDQLICGYIDDMSEGIRYKRSLYCLFPPRLGGSDVGDQENLRDYTDGCRKFLEFLRSRADASTGFPKVKFSTDWRKDITTSGSDAFKRVGQRSVKMLLHTNDDVTSQNWIIAKVDTELLPSQCYHVEIQWLVCRSSLVDDLITAISRRAKQLGLELQKVTENGISSNLDLHPLNCPIFLKIEDAFERRMVEKALVERFDFCCEALHPIPFTHLNHNAEYAIMTQEPRPPRARRMISYYRQYVHRSLACFARMTQTGLVWISNQKVHDDEIQPIFDELRQYIESLQVARSSLMGVIDGMFEPAAAASASASATPPSTARQEPDQKAAFAANSPPREDPASSGDKKLLQAASASASGSTSSCSEEEKENSPAAINVVVRNVADPKQGLAGRPAVAAAAVGERGAAFAAEPPAADPSAAATVTPSTGGGPSS